MLSNTAISLIVATIALVVIVLLAHTWWVNSRSATLTDLKSVIPFPDGSVQVTAARLSGQISATAWVGKPIELHVEALGPDGVKSTVASAQTTTSGATVRTAPGAIGRGMQVVPAPTPGDWARIDMSKK